MGEKITKSNFFRKQPGVGRLSHVPGACAWQLQALGTSLYVPGRFLQPFGAPVLCAWALLSAF